MDMLVNRHTGLRREPLVHKPRHGKTHHDVANGNKRRNHDRKMARRDWQQDSRATNATFPV